MKNTANDRSTRTDENCFQTGKMNPRHSAWIFGGSEILPRDDEEQKVKRNDGFNAE